MISSESVNSVLLVQSGALGDCVLQLRVAEAIRLALPAARLTWLGRDDWRAIAQCCTSIDETLGLDALAAHRLFQAGSQTDADLADRLGRFDLVVNGLSGPDSPVMDRLRRFARHSAAWYETKPLADLAQHICRQWLGQVAAQVTGPLPAVAEGIERYAAALADEPSVFLMPRREDLAEASARLQAAGVDPVGSASRLILLHPGSGGLHKCYPIEQYVPLCRILSQRDMHPVMLLGPAELDRWAERMSQLVRHCALIVDPPLPLLVALLSFAAGYVGNDSGPTHIAAATGAPTLALFGPTDPRVWRPLGPKVAVLRSQEHERGWADLSAEQIAKAIDVLTH